MRVVSLHRLLSNAMHVGLLQRTKTMRIATSRRHISLASHASILSNTHKHHLCPIKPLFNTVNKHHRHDLFRRTKTSSSTSPPPLDTSTDICSRKLIIYDIPGDLAEEICDIFLASGATSASLEEHRPINAKEQEIFADGGPSRVWDRCNAIIYFSIDESPETINSLVVDIVQGSLGLTETSFEISEVEQEDWVSTIMDSYQPVEIAEKLWIVPSERQPIDPNAVNIILQPGLAFGTGDHPTTRLCLRWLHSLSIQGDQLRDTNVLDYGTGSGILAVAALLFGAEKAVGTDIDELAIRAAAQNATLNNFETVGDDTSDDSSRTTHKPYFVGFKVPPESSEAVVAQLQHHGPFEICIANILMGPLISLAPLLGPATFPGGKLALSGILESQAPGVIEAYSEYFEDFEVQTLDGWALVTGMRKLE